MYRLLLGFGERGVEEVCICWPGIKSVSPKKKEGEGIRRLKEWSQGLFAKHAARVCTDEGSLWCRFVRAKYRFDGDWSSYLFKAS